MIGRRPLTAITRRRLVARWAGSLVAVPLTFPTATVAQTVAQQQGRVHRIGYLSAPSRASVESVLQVFLQTLSERGWVEGKNLVIEYRWADGNLERLPDLAADLVRSKVELIVAPASSAVLAAKNATKAIPIVMIFPADPVGLGLVTSLSRPGENVTGTASTTGVEIFAKQMQLLKEAVPQLTRVAVLHGSKSTEFAPAVVATLTAAGRALGISLQLVDARGPEAYDDAFAAMAKGRAEALFVNRDPQFLVHRARVAELAIKGRLPTICSFRESVEAGGLMAYAHNMSDFIGRSASYVDRILKGAKPGDLPVEQPTKFDLTLNLKTAKALGIAIPQALLLRADEVIR